MNCIDFEKRLDEQFGPARLEEAADLAEHAEQCALCRQTLEQVRLLSDSLELWREQVPEVDFTAAVVPQCSAQPESRSASSVAGPGIRSRAANAASSRPSPSALHAGNVARSFSPLRRASQTVWLAAGSLVALSVAAIFIFGPPDFGPPDFGPPDFGRPGVARQPNPQALTARIDDQPGDIQQADLAASQSPDDSRTAVPEELLAPQRAVYYDLAQKATGALGEVSAFVMTGSASAMSSSDAGEDESEGWIDGLQHQLRPIGRSLDDAFDFLWQAGQSAEGSQS